MYNDDGTKPSKPTAGKRRRELAATSGVTSKGWIGTTCWLQGDFTLELEEDSQTLCDLLLWTDEVRSTGSLHMAALGLCATPYSRERAARS